MFLRLLLSCLVDFRCFVGLPFGNFVLVICGCFGVDFVW